MVDSELKLVWDGKAILGEGPAWDPRSRQLIWVDIKGKCVHLFHPDSGTNRTIATDQMIGAAVPRKQGGLLLASENGLQVLDLESEQLSKLVDPESDKPGNRFNDGKCDASGRFWAGTMDNAEKVTSGSLYCLDVDGTPRTIIKDSVTVSNGIGWSPDNQTMYYIDSPTNKVVAYDFHLASGTISNPRTVVTIQEGEGSPDGMAVDAEGMLWVAQWGGWQVSRYNPHTGEKMKTISIPAAQTTSCAFGGDDYDVLYITTARIGIRDEDLVNQPNAGGLFAIKPGVKGLATNYFTG